MPKCPVFRRAAIFTVFLSLGGWAFAETSPRAQSLRTKILKLAEESGWQGYTFRGATGALPVLASRKRDVEKLASMSDDTVSFITNRKYTWGHSYIRVGQVIFDMWGIGEGARKPAIHIRPYRGLMKGSKNTRWYEALQAVDPADIPLLQQFYFYRSAIIQEAELARKRGDTFENPWHRGFVDRGHPPFNGNENCTGFVLAAFNEVFFKSNPSAADLAQIHKRALKLAEPYKVAGTFVSPEKLLQQIVKIPGKYKFDLVAAPPGLMRLANVSPLTATYIIHNAEDEDFINEHKMGFDAKSGGSSAIELGIDKSVRQRTPIAASRLARCERAVK